MKGAFFPVTVHRELIIRSANLLVGKDQTKTQKRIKLQLTMPLSGRSLVGMPGWLGDAYEFVMKTKDVVNLSIMLSAVNLKFCADDLFAHSVPVPKAEMKKFSVVTSGDSENPDVDVQFCFYANFSTDLWSYAGQMGGVKAWANFEDAVIGAAESSDDDEDEEGDDEEPEETPATAEESALFSSDQNLTGHEYDEEFKSPGTKPRRSRANA